MQPPFSLQTLLKVAISLPTFVPLAASMGKSTKKKQLTERINSLRKQYDAFVEEDKKRKERNDYILGRLNNMSAASAALKLRYNTLKPIEAPQTKLDSVQNHCLQVTPLRNGTLTQLNDEADENKILNEIKKRFILIPRNNSLLNQNFTHPKEKVDDIDWTSKYNILDQLKKSELEIDETKVKENKICTKKISFEDSTDDEKDIDTSLSENICERETYENNNIGDDTGTNAENYDNSRLQHNQLKNVAQKEMDQNPPINSLLNISSNKINKLQVEENKNEIQSEANILADGIIKSLQESNTDKFDPSIQNGQCLLENETNDINYKNDLPVFNNNAYNTQIEIQDEDTNKYNELTTNSPKNNTHDGYYDQQPGAIQDTSNNSNEHSEIIEGNYGKDNEEGTRAETQNHDYKEQNNITETNCYNEHNVHQPEEYQNEQTIQSYDDENIVTDNNHYNENTVEQAELYPTEQLNQNYEEQSFVPENNYYEQNNQQFDQYEHNLAEDQNQNYNDNNIVSENNYYDENNQQPVDQYGQLEDQQNLNYEEQNLAAENNDYGESNQQQVNQYEQLGEQENINYEDQPIVAENNYYDQQQANLPQQYSAEQPTSNYEEQNIVTENVYYNESGQQEASQYDQLAVQPVLNYDEPPVAVDSNYYDESNQQYLTEEPKDNNYQQEFNNDEEINQTLHEESNEQLIQD